MLKAIGQIVVTIGWYDIAASLLIIWFVFGLPILFALMVLKPLYDLLHPEE